MALERSLRQGSFQKQRFGSIVAAVVGRGQRYVAEFAENSESVYQSIPEVCATSATAGSAAHPGRVMTGTSVRKKTAGSRLKTSR